MEVTVPNTTGVEQKRVDQITLVLNLLKSFITDFNGDVILSEEMLKVGAKTALSDQIEKSIQDPVTPMFALSNDIDNNIKQMVNRIAIAFLKHKKEIINEVYISKTPDNSLYYSLVLKNDDLESRDTIFGFYDKYDLLDISSKYPVHFQFVPTELIGKLYNTEKVDLAIS